MSTNPHCRRELLCHWTRANAEWGRMAQNGATNTQSSGWVLTQFLLICGCSESWFCCFNHFLMWMILCEAAKLNDRDELTNEVADRRTARNQIQLKLSLANNRDENSHTRFIGVSCVYCVPIASMFVWWCLLQSTYIWSLNQIKPARTTHGVAQVVKVYLNVHAQRAQREAVYCPLPTSIVHIQTLVTPQRLSRCTIFKQFNQ